MGITIPEHISHTSRITASVLLFVFLSGCASTGPYQLKLMPAPDVYTDERDNLFEFAVDPAVKKAPYQGILYATDRQPVTTKSRARFYENERGHLLRLGLGEIRLGKGEFSWDEAKKISLLKNRGADYPLQVTGVTETGILNSSHSVLSSPREIGKYKSADKAFAAMINSKLAASNNKDVYVYLHGYKVVFSNPLLVSTELWHFLGYDGVFVAYAWPSTPSKWAYAKDLETAAHSARNLRLLLEYLASETRAHRIHIVAYSAGTRVAIDALAQLAMLNTGKSKKALARKLRIGNVILVGSDSDRDTFGGYLQDGLLNVMDRLTIYMSDTDKALGISNFLFARRRLGQVFSQQEMNPKVHSFLRNNQELITVDVTSAEKAGAGNGHAYFRDSPWVSSDVLMTLKYNLAPQERGLVRSSEAATWSFPADYVDKLKQNLKQHYRTR